MLAYIIETRYKLTYQSEIKFRDPGLLKMPAVLHVQNRTSQRYSSVLYVCILYLIVYNFIIFRVC